MQHRISPATQAASVPRREMATAHYYKRSSLVSQSASFAWQSSTSTIEASKNRHESDKKSLWITHFLESIGLKRLKKQQPKSSEPKLQQKPQSVRRECERLRIILRAYVNA